MRKTWRSGLLAAGLLASAGLTAACGDSGADSGDDAFVIGVIEDKSGGSTFYSQTSVGALKVFVDALNKGETGYGTDLVGSEKGILGQDVKLIFEDDQNNPNNTTLKVRSLLDRGADVIYFTSGSSSTLQGRSVCTQEKIFCFAPTNVNAAIVEAPNNEFVFTAAPPSSLSAQVYVDAWKDAGYRTIAFFDEETATSVAVADAYKAVAEKAGLEVVAEETLAAGGRDVTAPVARVLEKDPDVVFDATQQAAEAGALFKGLRQAGSTAPIWSQNSLTAQPRAWEIAGPAIDGVLVVDPLSPTNPRAVEVGQLLVDGGNDEHLTFIQTSVWDALLLTKKAFEDAGELDGAKAVAALEEITDFPGATGQESFRYSFAADRHNGSRADQNVVVEFADGKPGKLPAELQPAAE
ncbi:ABC transporter substrate-binding protein [Nocardioides sp. L-11A]|uniref:ABC transporter substrate-binding protein n=1 Tax=Nocardioides sp. L-11A TaxID=3043848 RepID=UPI00249A4ED2|nr:ABC transporter substrate-binding protein [Nocardioides sp. L-11A]